MLAYDEAAIKAKQIQDAVYEIEEKFRIIADSTPIAVMLYQDDRWIYANRAAETITGYLKKELLGMIFWDIVHPDHKALVQEHGQKSQRGEETTNRYEFKIITKDGTEKWVDLTGASMLIGVQPAGVVSMADITDRKRAQEALQSERDLLQTVMNSAGNSHLVYIDCDFNFVRVNETYAASCGYRPEEMIGKNLFTLYPNAENEAIFTHVRDIGKDFEVRDKPFEFPNQLKRGVTYWDWTLKAVKDPGGQVTGLVFSLYETTERKRNEEKMEQLVLELQEALAKVKLLSGLLPICAWCKKIRNDEGYWEQMEIYISKNSEAGFSHSICPECMEKRYPELNKK